MFHLKISVSLILILINGLVFLATSNNPRLVQRMMFVTNRVKFFREYDRLILAGFVHSGILHLLLNCLTLWFFGPAVEAITGPVIFVLIYLLSIVGGNLFCLLMRSREHGYAAVGASGGVLGIIFCFILNQPDARLLMMFIPYPIPAWIFGSLFSLVSIFLTQSRRAAEVKISHEGHLGGALVGALGGLAAGLADLSDYRVLVFIGAGVVPVILFGLVGWLAPGRIYRHRD